VTGPEQAMDDLRRAVADHPRLLAELTERAGAAAAATVTGEDESGLVTVTASGQGQILSVRVNDRALREWEAHQLAARVTTAVNVALSRAEAALHEATAGAVVDNEAATTAHLHAFEQRMDAAIDRLDRLGRDLHRLLGD
jgi:DNA-binding protein YbaB